MTNVEFGIYIPQIGLSYELLRDRAQLCEELGYSSFWCFDHLYGPGLPQHPALEGWTLATSLLAQTTFSGKHFEVRNFPNMPRPVQQPGPRLWVGGAGERRTLPLVARYADVWNCPTYALGDLDARRAVLVRECERIGRDPATIVLSLEAVLALAPNAGALDDVRALADRRFPGPGWRLHRRQDHDPRRGSRRGEGIDKQGDLCRRLSHGHGQCVNRLTPLRKLEEEP